MMEKDILSRVIEVEKEIQEKLREEKGKSLEWLEGVKREAEEELAREEERLREYYQKTLDDTGAVAEKQAAELLRDSVLQAERLSGISDEILGRILLKYLPRILPEEYAAAGRAEKVREPAP